MQSVSSRIWIRVAVSISCDDNHYTTGMMNVIYFYIIFMYITVEITNFYEWAILDKHPTQIIMRLYKKQKVPRKNNHRRRLRWWLSVTGEYA